MIAPARIRVLVVEDSPTQRAFLRRSLESDGDITVVAEAGTAVQAVAMAGRERPDVVTMDFDIPGGGLRAIEQIMATAASPILLFSGRLEGPRSPNAVDALAAGAAGVLAKPRRWDDDSQRVLRNRIRSLRRVRPLVPVTSRARAITAGGVRPSDVVVGIGASTGGPAALARVLADLGPVGAPVLCVQHIDGRQVDGLARWLSSTTGRDVEVATDGDALEPGVVLLGPGGAHLTLGRDRRVELVPDTTSLHTPSVDRLLHSLAEVCGSRAVGCVLTGMGTDGAAGMAALAAAGAYTIVQDEGSSVVHGMAGAAIASGGVKRVLPLDALGTAITRATRVAR